MLLDKSADVPMLQEDVKVELASKLSKITVEKINDQDLPKWIEEGAADNEVNVGGLHPKVESSENLDEFIGTLEDGKSTALPTALCLFKCF